MGVPGATTISLRTGPSLEPAEPRKGSEDPWPVGIVYTNLDQAVLAALPVLVILGNQ